MKTDENNPLIIKSFDFALRIVRIYKTLAQHRIHAIAEQILKSGTSIGANAKEAVRAQSKADFISKLNISLKEASETEYWLDLLYYSGYLPDPTYKETRELCKELIKILTAIIKSTRSNIHNHK